jgi:TRAP-type C4-dicarboxylate transport system permease small subunit
MTRVASVFLACAVVLMSVQVILRFGFNSPQAWAEEVDRYLFIWSVYLGATVALMRGTHIRVLFIIDRFEPKGEIVSQWLTRFIGIAAFAFTAYYGYQLAWVNRSIDFYTIQGVPQVLFYLAAPVGLTLMTLVLVADSLRELSFNWRHHAE